MHNTASTTSPKRSEDRTFSDLSARLNELYGEPAIIREAVNGVIEILNAPAALLAIFSPTNLVYSTYRQRSGTIASIEATLRNNSDIILSQLNGRSTQQLYKSDGAYIVPLTWQHRTFGMIAIDNRGVRPSVLRRSGLLFFRSHLSAILGIKYQEHRQVNAQGSTMRNEEIQEAAAFQKSLLPSLPSHTCGLAIAAHTHPADHVGGDYYDLITVDQNKLGIVIADIEGKGVPGALFGNLLRTTVHFLIRESTSTAEVLGKISSILHKEAVGSKRLFTIFYAFYDASSRMLCYTGSGHVSPIVVRANEHQTELLASEGTPIGIQNIQLYSQRSVQLQPGDLVAYYTDGVIEQTDRRGNPFGVHRLTQLLEANKDHDVEKIMETMIHEQSRFASSPVDDQTIILTKVL